MQNSYKSTVVQQISINSGEVFSVRWNYSGSGLAIGSTNSQAMIYSSDFGLDKSFSLQTGAERMPVSSIRFCPEHPELISKPLCLFTTSDGGMIHWNLLRNKFASFKRLSNEQIYSADYSPDGYNYILGCKEGVIKLFDHLTFLELSTFCDNPYSQGARKVFCLKWFQENLFLSGGWNDKVTIWDTRTPLPVRQMIGPHICGDSIDIKDNLLVAASYSIKDQLTIWDWTTASNLHTETFKTQEKKCMPYCAQFLRTEKNIIAIGGSGSDEVLLYDVNSHENIGSFSVSGNSVFSLHVSSQNQVAVVTGNKVEIHEITNQ